MANLTPYELKQLFPVSLEMSNAIEEENIENKSSLLKWVCKLLQASKLIFVIGCFLLL